ncbi:MAG: tetraacyldisaccharide 4'-kinase [Myxococcales bacterium]|nr:tetraacyldisaccharide 4'-kinase [Myxococcales bacterium]MCB9579179.1 tetraacyldisaccharide 4'-kinase [Polyangiaceae bacterium]
MLRRALAERLEAGTDSSPLTRGLARAYQWASAASRHLLLPEKTAVVGVGGATLGGSGKTPLCLALARALSQDGLRVAVVASGYRSRAGRARRVLASDAVEDVGDDALWLARALDGAGVPVAVAKRRQAAIDLVAPQVDVVLVDALLQTRPKRLALSLLVVDGTNPFGSGRCPPAGDLRAGKRELLSACDAVVSVGAPSEALSKPCYVVEAELVGATGAGGERWTLAELRGLRLGVALAVARPERVLRSLDRAGIMPHTVHRAADHDRPRPVAAPVEGWLVTPKCATKLGERLQGAPVFTLDWRLRPPASLLRAVAVSSPEKPGATVVESAPCLAPELS